MTDNEQPTLFDHDATYVGGPSGMHGGAADPVAVVPPMAPHRRPARAALLVALAVVAAGGTGGIVANQVTSHQVSASAAFGLVTRSAATVEAAASKTVSGTPESAAATISPSVVTIEVTGTQTVTGSFGGSQSQSVSDTGSGVVLRADGYLLTNNHVVAAAEGGGTINVTLADGRTVPATVVGFDATDDLAVLKASVTGLTAAVFADSDQLRVGQAVLAVGAPLGLSNTVTEGIVSTLHRPVATGEAGASAQSVIDAVQTDAAINPGNSGGALVDLAGRVVGINSAIASTGSTTSGQSGNIGVGFAIPSNDAAKVAAQLIATGHATHSTIGISVGDAASSTDGAPGLGATVRDVTAGGPAAKAGLQSGDIITKVDARSVTEANGLIVAVRSHDPGSTVTVTYLRAGATRTTSVTLSGASST